MDQAGEVCPADLRVPNPKELQQAFQKMEEKLQENTRWIQKVGEKIKYTGRCSYRRFDRWKNYGFISVAGFDNDMYVDIMFRLYTVINN